ncbi:MAG: glycosyltransferase family 92 protein [Akkermansiaceae bacterium]|nr:glycosyltransferase family 92 protein [Akkermansiaceae bacterium]
MDAASACGASIMRNATNSEAGQDEFGKQRRNAVSEYLQLRSCWRHPWPHLFLLPARLAALGYKYLRWKQAQGKTPPRWLCAAACMKNEASYIEEWLRYHLLVGVEHFYLYNNNSEDGIEEVLRPWIECGLVTYTVWPGRHQQFAMYRHALKKAAPETRWLALIDIDEFIQVLDGRKLSDFLREYGEASQLVIMWQHFGSNGRLKRDEGFVIERFTRREEGTCHVGKAITRPAAALDTLVHYCLVFGRSVDEDHLPLESFTPPLKNSASRIRVNHYAVKSQEEYALKKSRGYATPGSFSDDYFQRLDRNEVEDESMLPYAERIKMAISGSGGSAVADRDTGASRAADLTR